MILDASGKPFLEKSLYERCVEYSLQSSRDTLYYLTANMLLGWSEAQHRHWVQTGEEPQKPEHVK